MLYAVAIPACNTGPSVYPLQIDSLISAQQAKLLASDGAEVDLFGVAVAVSGNTALVGASRNDEVGTDGGAAYVFVRSGATWTQQAKLTADDGGAFDNFGVAVALSGDTALVGAMFEHGVASSSGAAYVFVRSGATWTQQAKLTAADGGTDDELGISVALEGDTAVVGSTFHNDDVRGGHSGAAYVFARGGTTWTQQGELQAGDGAASDQLGISVAVSGDTVVVGAYGDDDSGASSGSAYVFVRSGATWTQQAKLLASDGKAIDEFGVSVAISGNTALIGAVFGDAAYVFVRSGTAWAQQTKLTAADGASGDDFGNAVALVGDVALISAPNQRSASGAAYVFLRSGTTWTQDSRLTATGGASADFFGISVALSGDTAVIGAPDADDLGNASGSTYVFAPPPTTSNNGDACTTNAACSSGACVDGVCCDTTCGGGDPNDCQACSIAAGAAANGTCGPIGAGVVCRAATGACDVAEHCTGSTAACPSDGFAASSTVCRAAAGACDVAEHCTGSAAACPSDGFASSSTVCRPADGSCDATETCTGSSISCPSNAYRPNLSLCTGGLLGLPGVCLAGSCIL